MSIFKMDRNSLQFIAKELDHLAKTGLIVQQGTLAHPDIIGQLNDPSYTFDFSFAVRAVLLDVLQKAAGLLVAPDGGLIPASCAELKRYGYEVITLANTTDRVNVAYYIKSHNGLICFYYNPCIDSFALRAYTPPNLTRWCKFKRGLRLMFS